jgi:hypothetical protein
VLVDVRTATGRFTRTWSAERAICAELLATFPA